MNKATLNNLIGFVPENDAEREIFERCKKSVLNEYLKLSVDEAKEKIDALYAEVKEYGGHFSFIWHNSTIGQYGHWKGWREVLEHTLNIEKERK